MGLHHVEISVILITDSKVIMCNLTENYVEPICCVANVCHQVHSTYWGHLGHFCRAISPLKWHEMVCMRYLACTFSQMKSCSPCICNLEFPDISFGDLLWFEHRTSLFQVEVCPCWPQTLGAICRNMGIWNAFMLCPPGKYIWGLGHCPHFLCVWGDNDRYYSKYYHYRLCQVNQTPILRVPAFTPQCQVGIVIHKMHAVQLWIIVLFGNNYQCR